MCLPLEAFLQLVPTFGSGMQRARFGGSEGSTRVLGEAVPTTASNQSYLLSGM
jgi:hypothetical protein